MELYMAAIKLESILSMQILQNRLYLRHVHFLLHSPDRGLAKGGEGCSAYPIDMLFDMLSIFWVRGISFPVRA